MDSNALLGEIGFPFLSLSSQVPSSETCLGAKLTDGRKCAFVIFAENATTVTGSDITFEQATALNFSTKKAIVPTRGMRCVDVAAAGAKLSLFDIAAGEFTPQAVDSKKSVYLVEFDASELDFDNGYICVRPVVGDATAQTLTVVGFVYPARYAGEPMSPLV